jgi:N-acetylmuramoyl-L-alanine amidase
MQNPISSNSGVIKDISVNLNSNNETEIRITTTKLQGYEYVTDKDNIYINIGNPRDIYPNIVVLDPGHGGPANGAQYYGSNEKDFNLQILYGIGRKYFNSDTSKLKVYYTRKSDVDLTLAERAAYASKMGADLFVSLHMNASTAASAYGTEVYYSENNNQPNAAGLTSKTLANIMVSNLCSGLGTLNRGYKSEKYTVVHRNTVPAVLIEMGFLSNKNDYAKLSDPVFRDNAVRLIYETLLQVFEQYPTGR